MLSSSLFMSSSILALLFAVVVLSNMSSKTTSLSTGEIICKGNKGNDAEKFGIEIKSGEQKTVTKTKNGHLSLLFTSKISMINPGVSLLSSKFQLTGSSSESMSSARLTVTAKSNSK